MKKIALFLTAVLCLTLCLMIHASAEENTEEPAPESEGFRYQSVRLLHVAENHYGRRGKPRVLYGGRRPVLPG